MGLSHEVQLEGDYGSREGLPESLGTTCVSYREDGSLRQMSCKLLTGGAVQDWEMCKSELLLPLLYR